MTAELLIKGMINPYLVLEYSNYFGGCYIFEF